MSTEMNAWLASIYGTDGSEEIEKTAEAVLLQKLASENNIDLSQFSPEELQQLLAEVLGEEGAQQQMGAVPGAALQGPQVNTQQPSQPGMDMNPTQPGMGAQQQFRPQTFAPAQQQAQPQQQIPAGVMAQQSAPSQEAMMKEAQAKFEEADMLGRVMAHAYTDELEKIASSKTKTAGRFGAAKDAVKGALNSARNRGGHMAERAGAKARSYGTMAGMKARAHKGAIGAAAATGAAGFVAGRKTKEASAFEKLAEMQAAEILGAAGFDPSTGTDLYGQQDQQAQEQVQPFLQQGQQQEAAGELQGAVPQEEFQTALDNRALELLAANGYDVNEILARIQMAQGQDPGQA